MIGPPLRDDQIAETLRAHGYSLETNILGVSYGTVVTVNVYGAKLIVPTKVLKLPPAEEERRAKRHLPAAPPKPRT